MAITWILSRHTVPLRSILRLWPTHPDKSQMDKPLYSSLIDAEPLRSYRKGGYRPVALREYLKAGRYRVSDTILSTAVNAAQSNPLNTNSSSARGACTQSQSRGGQGRDGYCGEGRETSNPPSTCSQCERGHYSICWLANLNKAFDE
ncbi:hypothetical protein AJ78_08754 [Emergomyces pasteurianus Ep9510]|uniref:Uncharacterized protein n=1 Tax=Emergomyces pasteurianus Ep9510 TaxID=1447872 RepID=A0A1J9Q1H5_9EURO|nr:hypothetical protein AJ78_08754 [Emergomyces pasteurianus Ep9510]